MAFRSESLADQVFAKLENDIVVGVYPRGEILTELKLAEILGVSRTPIREALRRLEQERLIEDTGKGSLVRGISAEDVMDIMDIRIRIEALAASHAANNRSPEALEELKHILELQEFYATKNDPERMRVEDEDFHDAICRLCGRMVISDVLGPLQRKTRQFRKISLENQSRQPQSVEEHWAIYDAIAAGNGELAAELTAKHIEKAKLSMIERLKENG